MARQAAHAKRGLWQAPFQRRFGAGWKDGRRGLAGFSAAVRSWPRNGPRALAVDRIPGGYVVRDANGQALAYLYARENATEAIQGAHRGRGAADRRQTSRR
jgi:hypothetical protein